MRIPHILHTLTNFLVFFEFWVSFEHPLSIMNSFKQYSSHTMSQNFFKISKKWRMGIVRRMWGFHTFFVPFLIFRYFGSLIFFGDYLDTPLSVMNSFKQYPSHMISQNFLKTSNKWRMGRVRRMWGFLTFFVPFPFFKHFFMFDFFEPHLKTP